MYFYVSRHKYIFRCILKRVYLKKIKMNSNLGKGSTLEEEKGKENTHASIREKIMLIVDHNETT
jgi:hypothetical protein